MTICFDSLQEFARELATDPPKILRVTKILTRLGNMPLQRVSVIATFVNSSGQIVKLDRPLGQILGDRFPENEVDRFVMERADKIIKQLEALVIDLHVEIRAGVFE